MVAALLLLKPVPSTLVLVALSVSGQLLTHGFTPPPLSTYGYIGISWVETLMCAALAERWTDPARFMARVRDVPAFVSATLAAVSPTAVVAGALAQVAGDAFTQGFITWWVGGTLGMLLFTPLAIAWRRGAPVGSALGISTAHKTIEICLLAFVVAGGAVLAFRGTVLFGLVDVSPYALALPVMWTSLRYGLRGVTASLLLIIVVGVPLLLDPQSVALGGTSPDARLLRMQVYIALMTVSGLTLSAALEERRASAEEQARSAEALLQRERELRDSRHLEAVGKLAGGVAHDFNNILAAMTLQVQELRESTGTVGDNLDVVDEMQDSVLRASRLTRQLLMFSQKQATAVRLVDFTSLVDDSCRVLRRMMPASIRLEVSSGMEPLWVEADESMLEQVVMNLVLNARDAISADGVVTVALGTGRLDLPALQERGLRSEALGVRQFAILEVTDTGGGIPSAIQQRVFDPFFTTKAVGKGTGLGLSTAYGIAQQHHGFVRIAETSPSGTRFEFGIPAAESPLARESATHEASQDRASAIADAVADEPERGCILVVDDDADVRRSLSRVLERDGWQVVVATSGRDALERWALFPPVSVVLTDVVMPHGVSGVDLAQRLAEIAPRVPVVFMSGFDPSADAHAALFVHGVNFLQKPTGAEQLRQLLIRARASVGE